MTGQQPGSEPVPVNNPDGTNPASATPRQSAASPNDSAQAAPGTVFGGAAAPDQAWGRPQESGGQGWGAPATPNPRTSATKSWASKRGLAAAAVAVVLAAGAGVGAFALTSGSAAADGTTAASGINGRGAQSQSQGVGPGTGQSGQGSAQGGTAGEQSDPGVAGGLLAAVHAEYVVLENGNHVTRYEQSGTVTDISSTAVTVKSADGFTRSYTLGTDVVVSNQRAMRQQAGGTTATQLSVSDIAAGSTVQIVAAADGADFAAVSVMLATATADQGN